MIFDGGYKYILVLTVAFLVTYLCTPIVAYVARALGIVDRPDSRRIHVITTPRAGGIAIVLGFQAAVAVIFLFPWMSSFNGELTPDWWKSFSIASSLLLIVGIVDDKTNLRWELKLLGQILPALIMISDGFHFNHLQGISLPVWLDGAITLLWFLAFMNAFNLIDGLDGLASGLAVIASLGIAGGLIIRRSPADALVALSIGASCLAFLRFNFHPARVFLGDSGSMFLGFALASIALSTSSKGTALATIGVPFLAIGVPVFDTILAIWRRSVRAFLAKNRAATKLRLGGVMVADTDHLHHRLMRAGLTQRKVALFMYLGNAALVVLGLLSLTYHSRATGIFLIAFVVGAYVIVKHLASVELWDSGSAILRGISMPQSPVLVAVLYPVLDALLLSGCLLFTLFILEGQIGRHDWLNGVPFWCGLPFVGLFLTRTYSRVWSRARISEFGLLGLAVVGGTTLALGLSLLQPAGWESLGAALIFGSLATVLIAGVRVIPRLTQDLMLISLLKQTDRKRRLLVYGAHNGCILYLRQLGAVRREAAPLVVGLIDDDPNLRKRYVYGFQVLGAGVEIPRIVKENRITDILLTIKLSPEKTRILTAFAVDKNITLKKWIIREATLAETSKNTERPPYEASFL